jgi:hypothetical protein
MTIFWSQHDGRESLHCRLENASARTLQIDLARVPWKTPGLFDWTALTAKGKIVYKTSVVESLVGGPDPVSLSSGQALEGDIDFRYVPIPAAARREDLILMWRHGVRIIQGSDNGALSGVTFLPKRSQ